MGGTRDEGAARELSLTREEMARVLDRAVTLEAEGVADMPLSELREIAREADISPAALTKAVEEVVAAREQSSIDPVAPAEPKRARWLDWPLVRRFRGLVEGMGVPGRVVVAFLAGFIASPQFGFFVPLFADPALVSLIVVGVLGTAAGVPLRGARGTGRYLGELAVLWGAWMAAVNLSVGFFWDDVSVAAVGGWIVTALTGTLLRWGIDSRAGEENETTGEGEG